MLYSFVPYILLKNKNVYLACPQTGKSKKSQHLKAKSEKNGKFRKMIYAKSQDFVVNDLSIF